MELKYIKRILKNPHSFIRGIKFNPQLICDILNNSKDQYQYEKRVFQSIRTSSIVKNSFIRGGYQYNWTKDGKDVIRLVYSNKSVLICCFHISKQEYKIMLVYFDRSIIYEFYKKMPHYDSSSILKQKFYQSDLKNYCNFSDSNFSIQYVITMESYLSSKEISPKLIESLESNWEFWDYISKEYQKEVEKKLLCDKI